MLEKEESRVSVSRAKSVTIYTTDGDFTTYENVVIVFNPEYSNWVSISYLDPDKRDIYICYNYANILHMDMLLDMEEPKEVKENE